MSHFECFAGHEDCTYILEIHRRRQWNIENVLDKASYQSLYYVPSRDGIRQFNLIEVSLYTLQDNLKVQFIIGIIALTWTIDVVLLISEVPDQSITSNTSYFLSNTNNLFASRLLKPLVYMLNVTALNITEGVKVLTTLYFLVCENTQIHHR